MFCDRFLLIWCGSDWAKGDVGMAKTWRTVPSHTDYRPVYLCVFAPQPGQSLLVFCTKACVASSCALQRRSNSSHDSLGGWASLCRKQYSVPHTGHVIRGCSGSPVASCPHLGHATLLGSSLKAEKRLNLARTSESEMIAATSSGVSVVSHLMHRQRASRKVHRTHTERGCGLWGWLHPKHRGTGCHAQCTTAHGFHRFDCSTTAQGCCNA